MTGCVLLTLGRLPKALDLARGFHGAGWRVVVADPFSWHLCRLSRSVAESHAVTAPAEDPAAYRADLLRVIEAEGVDLVVPVSEESLYAVTIADALPPGVRLFSEPQARLLELHDKARFIERARALGLPVPQTERLGSEAAEALARTGQVVIKPIHGCSGGGVLFCEAGEALPDAGSRPPCVVQQRLSGRHLSSFTLAHEGKVRASVLYEGTVFSGSVAVAFRRLARHAKAEAWIGKFLAESGYSGFLSFDFIEEDGECLAIECNPRVTSGIHFLEPRALAEAVIDPESQHPIAFRREQALQQFFPCLTETQAALLKGRGFREKLGWLLRSRDVMWSWRDPLPLWLMTFAAYQILYMTIFKGLTFGEAATRDIAWREEPGEAQAD